MKTNTIIEDHIFIYAVSCRYHIVQHPVACGPTHSPYYPKMLYLHTILAPQPLVSALSAPPKTIPTSSPGQISSAPFVQVASNISSSFMVAPLLIPPPTCSNCLEHPVQPPCAVSLRLSHFIRPVPFHQSPKSMLQPLNQ